MTRRHIIGDEHTQCWWQSTQHWLRLTLCAVLIGAQVTYALTPRPTFAQTEDDASTPADNPDNISVIYLPLLRDPRDPRDPAAGPEPSPTQTTLPTVTNTPTDGNTPAPTNTPLPGTTATSTPVASATSTSQPIATTTPTQMVMPSDVPTQTATPSNTPTPTQTVTPTTPPGEPPAEDAFIDIVWEELGSGAWPKYGNSEGQSVVMNNLLYSFSGYGNTYGPKPWVFVFDPTQGTEGRWSAVSDMPPMRDGTEYGGVTHSGIATDDRYVYFAGGYPASSTGSNGQASGQSFGTRYVMRYDTVTDTYQRLPNLPEVRGAGTLAIVNGWLHFFGGTNSARTTETAEHWAIALDGILTNSWQVRASLPNPRHHMAAVSYNGKIYAIGGQHKHDGALIPQSSVHRYDPVTDTWTEMAPLLEPRNHIGSATLLIGGKIIVLGGQSQHGDPESEVFVYDIATNTWSQISSLPQGRHSAVAGIINGKIYLANGPTTDGTNRRTYRGTLVYSQEEARQLQFAATARTARNANDILSFASQGLADFSSFVCGLGPLVGINDLPDAPVAYIPTMPVATFLQTQRRHHGWRPARRR